MPLGLSQLSGFIVYGTIGYFLVIFNNTFGIIRMRASMQTSVFYLLIALCPSLHTLHAGSWAACSMLVALFFLFGSYQLRQPMSHHFYASLSIGIGSLILPQLTFYLPLFWIGAYLMQSLSLRSFIASLLGWAMPYWFLFGYAYFHNRMELFTAPFQALATFGAPQWSFQPWEWVTLGFLLLLFAASAGHCLMTGFDDKIRTRAYLNFLILVCLGTFIHILLQPSFCAMLLPVLILCVSILTGHLFVLTDSRGSNRFFIGTLIMLFALFVYNLWIH